MNSSIIKTSILATWISLPFSTWGAHLRTQSPQFNEWVGVIHSQFDDLPGAGLWFLYFWPAMGFIYLFYTLLITAGMVVMWAAAKRESLPVKIISLAISIVFLLLALQTFTSVLESLFWGFYILAAGELLLVIGLVCSVVWVYRSFYADY